MRTLPSAPPPRKAGRFRPRRARLLVLAGVVIAAIVVGVLVGRDNRLPAGVPVVPTPPGKTGEAQVKPVPDPFAWTPGRSKELARRAAAGTAHPLYTQSPGGAVATAERVGRYRPQVERAARRARVDPATLEALVFLESAGREDAVAGQGTEGAVGLTQILAETGQNLLGMRIDVEASRRASRRIDRALRRGRLDRVERLRAQRRVVDERFDPAKALDATARYLAMARRRFGREDLAFVSYHMGMGNLETVLRAYSGRRSGPIRDVVSDEGLSYAKVYFDSTPRRHAAAQRRLASFGDDSSNYLWKLGAARRIMRLARNDPAELQRLADLQTAKNSAEEVLHPGNETARFAEPKALREAWDDDDITAVPDRPRITGLARDPSMGELAERLDQPRGLYRGLHPSALAAALYIGAQVRAFSEASPLIVTSTVRDERYQRLLAGRNREATRNYSLHTTGWAFDVARTYRSRRQALAFQFVLDRLQVLDVIAWVREPGAIHVTASRDSEALLPLLERIR